MVKICEVFLRSNTTEKNTDIGRWTQSLHILRKENEIDSLFDLQAGSKKISA